MKKFFSKKSAKIVCSFLMTVCMLLALFPLSGGFKACALTEGEIFYVDTHSNAVNSFTGGAYRSGGNTVRFLKTKTNEKICYCIQPGVGFNRTKYKAIQAKNDPFYLNLKADSQENAALAAMFGFPIKAANQLGVPTDSDAYAATQALIWEYITGDSSYKNGIIGTPAETAYRNILADITAYKADKRYLGNSFKNNMLFTFQTATSSTEQALICYIGDIPKYALDQGNIEIYKKDEFGAALSGAYFTAVNTADPSGVFVIGPTDDKGYAKTQNIPHGTYLIKETVFPSGYRSSGATEWTVTLNKDTPNGIVTVNAVNEQIPGGCRIVKTSEDGNVADITFTLAGNGVNKTVRTNSSGEIQIDGLRPGKYTITEQAYDKYEPQESRNVTVVSGQTATVTFNNTLRRGNLKVIKTSEDSFVEGIKFHLYGTSLSGLTVDEYAVTDESGTAEFNNVLISGDEPYTLEEYGTDKKYVIPDTQSVIIEWNKTINRNFRNVLKKWRAEACKFDRSVKKTGAAQGNATLEGAVYGLYKDGILIEKYTTDKNGCFTTEYYPCGDDWTIREITPSTGYLLDTTVYRIDTSAEVYSVELNTVYPDVFEEIIKGNIAIIKHTDDGATKIETPEAGAEFEIYLKSAGSYEKAKLTERDILVCDKDGFAKSSDLPYGIYTVHQTKGLSGRKMMPDFEVTISENGKCYKYLINNASFEACLKIVKADSETGKTIPYAGATFEIYDPDGKLVEMTTTYPSVERHTQFKTNKDGYLITPEVLKYGLQYSIVEVAAPYGYLLDKTPVYFDVRADNSEIFDGITIIITEKKNTPQKGVINIYKSGETFSTVICKNNKYIPIYLETGLNGAEFDIIADEDIITPDGTLRYCKNETAAHIVTTDGYASSKALYLGKYRIEETKAGYGMVLNRNVFYAELAYAGQEIKLTSTSVSVQNERQKAVISLSKVMEHNSIFGIGNSGEVKSVSFGLYAAEKLTAADGSFIPTDGLLETAYCDENGKLTFNCDIPIGAKLYVREITTDNHYIISSQKFPIEFNYADQTVSTVEIKVDNGIKIKNKLIYGSLKGLKVDENGKPVSGAVFGLFAKNETEFSEKNALMTAISGESGVFVFEKIPFGSWLICEIKTASEKYVLNKTVYPVEISEDGKAIEYEVENRFVCGSVQVTKTDADYPEKQLTGSVFEVYIDSNGNKSFDVGIDKLVGELNETELGVYRMDELKYGGYFLYEKTPPDNYIKTDGYFYFEIKNDGETVNIENSEGMGFANKPVVGSLKIVKNSDDGKVKDFSFRVIGENGYDKVFKTDANGEIVIDGLRLGKYIVSEIADGVSEGYILAEDVTVTIEANKEIIVEMHNKKVPIPEEPKSPQTGDDFNIEIYILIILISAISLVVLLLTRKGNFNKQ